jgi:hypothetical protein
VIKNFPGQSALCGKKNSVFQSAKHQVKKKNPLLTDKNRRRDAGAAHETKKFSRKFFLRTEKQVF